VPRTPLEELTDPLAGLIKDHFVARGVQSNVLLKKSGYGRVFPNTRT